MQSKISELAEYFAALWRISPGSTSYMHESSGVIDLALHDIHAKLPARIRNQLSFTVTGVGLRCLQWSEISDWMSYGHMVDYDVSTFTRFRVCMSDSLARIMMAEQGFQPADYEPVAQQFYEAVTNRTRELFSSDVT